MEHTLRKVELTSKIPVIRGCYRIIRLKPKPAWIETATWLRLLREGMLEGMIISKSPLIQNHVVFNADHGVDLFLQHLSGDTTYPLELDFAGIGTGTTPPTDSDTDLETPVVTEIVRAIVEKETDHIRTEWFITNDELPNGTYNEFGLYSGTQLFCRSLIEPSHTKSDNEDTLIEYFVYASNDFQPES